MILTLNKPINISLQAKASTITNGFPTHSGAWDIIYFMRVDQGTGKASGNIYRLGKVIDFATSGEILSPELVVDGSLNKPQSLTLGQNTDGEYWSTQNKWEIVNGVAKVVANDSSTSTFSQSPYPTNFYVPQYLENDGSPNNGHYIVSGNTYQVRFDVVAVGSASSNIKVGGYTQPAADIFDETTSLGTKKVTFTATSNGLKIIASANASGWEIDKISAKQVYSTTNETYVVRVEPDTTAQTPDDGDFIFFGKDNEIGTAGVTGYYATVEMKNDSINYAELFAVSSEITLSSK